MYTSNFKALIQILQHYTLIILFYNLYVAVIERRT